MKVKDLEKQEREIAKDETVLYVESCFGVSDYELSESQLSNFKTPVVLKKESLGFGISTATIGEKQ